VTVVFSQGRLSDVACGHLRATYTIFDSLIAGALADGLNVSSDYGAIGTRVDCPPEAAAAFVESEYREGRAAAVMQFCRKFELVGEGVRCERKNEEGVEGCEATSSELCEYYVFLFTKCWYIVTHFDNMAIHIHTSSLSYPTS
jgi:hypothetical protein